MAGQMTKALAGDLLAYRGAFRDCRRGLQDARATTDAGLARQLADSSRVAAPHIRRWPVAVTPPWKARQAARTSACHARHHLGRRHRRLNRRSIADAGRGRGWRRLRVPQTQMQLRASPRGPREAGLRCRGSQQLWSSMMEAVTHHRRIKHTLNDAWPRGVRLVRDPAASGAGAWSGSVRPGIAQHRRWRVSTCLA
jgi:hypothetical protein